LSCINPAGTGRGIVQALGRPPMRRFAMKALFTALNFNRSDRTRIDWDRTVLIASTAVTVGLVVLYLFGKSASRW
jgi:hypothetical protein